jgi:hypothetical protein
MAAFLLEGFGRVMNRRIQKAKEPEEEIGEKENEGTHEPSLVAEGRSDARSGRELNHEERSWS